MFGLSKVPEPRTLPVLAGCSDRPVCNGLPPNPFGQIEDTEMTAKHGPRRPESPGVSGQSLKHLAIISLRLLGLIMAVLVLLVQPVHASIVESFEGLSPCPNIALLQAGLGVLKPGITGPFTFPSGVTFTSPIPNPSLVPAGIQVDDFSLGQVGFGIGLNGLISSPVQVPNGNRIPRPRCHPRAA